MFETKKRKTVVQKAHSVLVALFFLEFLTSHTSRKKKRFMKYHSQMVIIKVRDGNDFASGSPKTSYFPKLNEFLVHENVPIK